MEYTINNLSKLAGISGRTLRYYDEIGILKPGRISSSGYRIYGQKQVDILQQILFYKELGFQLCDIKKIIYSPEFNEVKALLHHHEKLLHQRNRLDALISNVEKTISQKEGKIIMRDKEKFEGFKEKMIVENEEKYGTEIRKKYGDEQVDKSNAKYKSMTQEQNEEVIKLGEEIKNTLTEAYKTGDPAGEKAQYAVQLHKQWLSYFWDFYNKEAHAGLAKMYVDDERFTAYYDEKQPGTAEFFRDAIYIFLGMGTVK